MSACVTVLLLDDEVRFCGTLKQFLEPHGLIVDAYIDQREFMLAASTRQHHLVLIDWNLRTCEGTDLIATLRLEGDSRVLVLISGKLETQHAHDLAEKSGADAFLSKSTIRDWPSRLTTISARPRTRRVSAAIRRPPVWLEGNIVHVPGYSMLIGLLDKVGVRLRNHTSTLDA